jgi:hypothetical protein
VVAQPLVASEQESVTVGVVRYQPFEPSGDPGLTLALVEGGTVSCCSVVLKGPATLPARSAAL